MSIGRMTVEEYEATLPAEAPEAGCTCTPDAGNGSVNGWCAFCRADFESWCDQLEEEVEAGRFYQLGFLERQEAA